jgi:CRP-like cAMP-binding protein
MTPRTSLNEVDLFQDFPSEAIASLAASGQTRTFAAGAPLLRQGEVGLMMYVIVRGRVRKERSHPDFSEPAEVFELGAGESVGELGLLDGNPRPETVVAVEETETIELSAGLLAETLLRYPVLSVGLLGSFSRSVRTLDELEDCARTLRRRAPAIDQAAGGS